MSSILLISPLSDRFNGVGNFGAPALGVWRLKANAEKAGHVCDVWDCNVGPEIPACADTESLVKAFLEHLKTQFDPGAYDWVGFSILNDTLPLTLGLANLLKMLYPHVKQIAGNAEATLNYQDVLDKSKIDGILVGEADFSLPDLLSGKEPSQVDGCIWFNRATRMSPEQFYEAYAPLNFGTMPLVEYGIKTLRLYCKDGESLDDATLRKMCLREMPDAEAAAIAGMTVAAYLYKLYRIMTVRITTMDHCFLPCTYCFVSGLLVTEEHGKQDIRDVVGRWENKERVRVVQHDGTFGQVVRGFRRRYDGEVVVLETRGGERLEVTPEHLIHVLGADGAASKKPAKDVTFADSLLVVGSDGEEYKRIGSIGSYRHNGYVFNVEVTPGHTYTVNGIAVDNCSTARIPDFATGKFERSVFLPIEAVKNIALRIKREVPGVLGIYDDSDETFLGTKRGLEYAAALQEIKAEMDAGTPHGFEWLVQTRSNEMTRELVVELAKAGVKHLTFGVENASEYVRNSIRKKQDNQQLLDLIGWCVESKVVCYYLLILFPPETRIEDLRVNVDTIREWVRLGATVSAEPYLMPYRGTPILEDPRYQYEHVTYDVPFSGTVKKRLKWPTLILPRDPDVRALMLYFRDTLDAAIKDAKEKAGHKHVYKGFTGIVCVEHLAYCLELYDGGQLPGTGKASKVGPTPGADGTGAVHPVYQEYADQESGADVRDRARDEKPPDQTSMQANGGRFNETSSQFVHLATGGGTGPEPVHGVGGLKQGASKIRMEKDPKAPGEIILEKKSE